MGAFVSVMILGCTTVYSILHVQKISSGKSVIAGTFDSTQALEGRELHIWGLIWVNGKLEGTGKCYADVFQGYEHMEERARTT